MRVPFGLTGRAAAFVGSGAAALVLGWYQGWPPIVQLGAFLLFLPLLSLLVTLARRDQVSARRLIATHRPELGDRVAVTIEVTPRGGGMGPILVSDEAPDVLGGAHLVAVAGIARQGVSRHRMSLVAGRRGRYLLGPARMMVSDRVGLVSRSQVIVGTTELVVVPKCHELASGIPGGAVMGAGQGGSGAAGGSQDDVIPRDYHPGDELRRVDWRATARTGTLMVRGEEQPWRASLLVVLDARERSHRGPPGADSLEAALSLVASVGSRALLGGLDLRVVDTTGTEIYFGSPSKDSPSDPDLLLALADVGYTTADIPDRGLPGLSDGGPVLVVLGALSPGATDELAATLGGAPRLAVVVAASSWAADDPSVVDRIAAEQIHNLSRQGWTTAVMTRADGVPAAWERLCAAASQATGTSSGGLR